MEIIGGRIDLGRLAGVADGAELPVVLRWLRRQRGLSQRALATPLNLAAHSAIVDYESGHRMPSANILAAYERFFGLPGGGLQVLRERALSDRAAAEAQRELSITSGAAVRADGTPSQPARRPLAQLPLGVRDFTGRDTELRQAEQAVRGDRAAMLNVSGLPGVGKTVLAIRLARLLADCFPDGQLFADLNPGGSGRLPPETVLVRFLQALGVTMAELPPSLGERSCLFRSVIADARILILLDNVADEGQVRPLLPGTPGCMTIMTSRSVLSGLEGANRLLLDLPRTGEALELFGRVIGDRRPGAEDAASRQVVRLCARLPLAIRIAGARLAARPGWPVAELARRLGDERDRLTELTAGDCAVRATFEPSYLRLDLQERQVFRQLGRISTATIRIEQVAAVTGCSGADIQPVLERLADLSLVQPADPGCYRMHDLIRLFAVERGYDDDVALPHGDAAIRAV